MVQDSIRGALHLCRCGSVTLNQRFRWVGSSSLQAIRSGKRICTPAGKSPSLGRKVGTRHIAIPLANTAESALVSSLIPTQGLIKLIGKVAYSLVNLFASLNVRLAQLEQFL
jgi:hypothetical protein